VDIGIGSLRRRFPLPYLDERNLQKDQPESLPEPEPAASCPDKYSSGTLS